MVKSYASNALAHVSVALVQQYAHRAQQLSSEF